MKWTFRYAIFLMLVTTFTVVSDENRFNDAFLYRCENPEQPSSAPFLKHFSPHMLEYAVDIDFVVKQTGVCTSLLIALIEQQSGLIRQQTNLRKPWAKPFGELSEKFGFIAQLVDVAKKLRELKNRSYSGYLPAHEKMSYLFNVELPKGTPRRLLQDDKRLDFQILYRDMFMVEYRPMRYLHTSDFGLRQDLLLRSWQFRQNLVRSLFAITR